MKSRKVLIILGTTASGKSDMAVRLAREIQGEVISADSRQVYKGLDIGTGKITAAEMNGVPHLLLDVADYSERFSVTKWKELATVAINDILARGRFPIICGGTGFYISALTDKRNFPEVESDPEEMKLLEAKSADELMAELYLLDKTRAGSMQSNGENFNKRRIARAIVVARALGKVPSVSTPTNNSILDVPYPESAPYPKSDFDFLKIGSTLPDTELRERIRARVISRMSIGMIEEAEKLHAAGLSYERMTELGLEYKYLAQLLQKTISKEEFIELLTTKIWQYARRQKTWFKKDKDIKWFVPNQYQEILDEVKRWLI